MSCFSEYFEETIDFILKDRAHKESLVACGPLNHEKKMDIYKNPLSKCLCVQKSRALERYKGDRCAQYETQTPEKLLKNTRFQVTHHFLHLLT